MKKTDNIINKKIKAQFNDLCTAAIICEMKSITISAGAPALNTIEVTERGINIQTAPEKPLMLNATEIYGPYYKWNTDALGMFVPQAINLQPRASFQIPFSDTVNDLVGVTSTFALISGGGI